MRKTSLICIIQIAGKAIRKRRVEYPTDFLPIFLKIRFGESRGKNLGSGRCRDENALEYFTPPDTQHN